MRFLIVTVLVVMSVPTWLGAQTIEIGQTVNDELTTTDAVFQNGSHYRIYELTGQRGTQLAISLSSDHFDAKVVLLDADGNRVGADDDSGGACNALLNAALPESGNFQVVVNTGYAREIGRFALEVSEGTGRPSSTAGCAGFVQPAGVARLGQVATETLGGDDSKLPDGSFYDSWIIPIPGGSPVTIDLASDDFDAHLTLMTPRGAPIGQDDNGAGGCNARIIHGTTDGQVRALVRARTGGGSYTLNVTGGTAPINYRNECTEAVTTDGGSVAGFNELQDEGRVMSVSGQYLGALTNRDPRLDQDQTRVQAWAVQGEEGDQVTLDLTSDDFDSYLMVFGPGLPSALADDDGAGGCNSRISFQLRSEQPYRVIVNHSGEEDTGEFQITVSGTAGPPVDEPCLAGPPPVIEDLGSLAVLAPEGGLFLGERISGALDANDILHSTASYVEAWTVAGTVGETVTVTLRSTAFDAYLYILGPGIQGALRDDDGAGACDARITITFPQTETYRVIFTTSRENEVGAFQASLLRNPEPLTMGACEGAR